MKRYIKAGYREDEFYQQLMSNGGKCRLPKLGRYKENRYVYLLKVNDDNFILDDSLRQQLIDEGKYDNSYICVLWKDEPLPLDGKLVLPVYGGRDSWVTRWFKPTPEEAYRDAIDDTHSDMSIHITGKQPPRINWPSNW